MFNKSIYFDSDRYITEITAKLEEKKYNVEKGNNSLILRPKFKKNIEWRSIFYDKGFFLYVNKITLIHKGEYIFIKVKLNNYLLYTGIIFFSFFYKCRNRRRLYQLYKIYCNNVFYLYLFNLENNYVY